MRTGVFSLILLSASFMGCEKREEKPPPSDVNLAVVLKVSVLRSGKLLVDGVPASLADLDAALAKLKSQKGVVLYYREAGQGESSPTAIDIDVMEFVVKHKVPIRFSSKSDFSDAIDEHGASRRGITYPP